MPNVYLLGTYFVVTSLGTRPQNLYDIYPISILGGKHRTQRILLMIKIVLNQATYLQAYGTPEP